ncbi:unnamed protein product [Cylindrotheca closterium]|uniref:Leucine-rich repeat domain-containing protein n=1 Tax=Cylindrotheca closterium TaxID=2856 RepID=A0AAD2PU26_9STRA|nr:unnamed protein product [Cylindrotheca closterium]
MKAFTYVGGMNQEDVPPPGTELLIIDPSAASLSYYLCNLCKATLQKIIFPPDCNVKYVEASAFANCQAFHTVDIPATVRAIGNDAFYQCTALMELYLSEGLERIDKRAFYGCCSLSIVEFPSSLCMIATRAFYGCRSLKKVTFAQGSSARNPARDVYICREAFGRCSSLQRIRLPRKIKFLKEGTFSECEGLQQVDLPDRLVRIEPWAFYQCSSLLSISIPSSVNVIENNGFRHCTGLVSVELQPGSLLKIQEDAFRGCKSLCNISTERLSGFTYAQSAFEDCELLMPRLFDDIDRYEGYPVHAQCYQASTSTAEELRATAEAMTQNENNLEGQLADAFYMTPFHILLSAAKRRKDLLEVLLDVCPTHILGWEDVLGNRPLDYLATSCRSDEAKRMMRMALHKWMVASMTTWGLETWRTDMKLKVNAILDCCDNDDDTKNHRDYLLKIAYQTLWRYERLEATTLLELWLWKMEMEAARIVDKRVAVDRSSTRHRCGAPFVIPTVIGYLGTERIEVNDAVPLK